LSREFAKGAPLFQRLEVGGKTKYLMPQVFDEIEKTEILTQGRRDRIKHNLTTAAFAALRFCVKKNFLRDHQV
jgi:hypothetical protein